MVLVAGILGAGHFKIMDLDHFSVNVAYYFTPLTREEECWKRQ